MIEPSGLYWVCFCFVTYTSDGLAKLILTVLFSRVIMVLPLVRDDKLLRPS